MTVQFVSMIDELPIRQYLIGTSAKAELLPFDIVPAITTEAIKGTD